LEIHNTNHSGDDCEHDIIVAGTKERSKEMLIENQSSKKSSKRAASSKKGVSSHNPTSRSPSRHTSMFSMDDRNENIAI
jgi:hypothetical protein